MIKYTKILTVKQQKKNSVPKHQAIKKIFTKKCWKYFLISSLLSTLQVVAYVAVILLLEYISAAMVNDSSKWLFPSLGTQQLQIAVLVPMLLGICIISFGLGLIGNRFSIKFAKNIAINTRNLIYTKIQDFSMVDIENFSQSSLINRLTIDATNIATATEFSARVLVKSILLYIGGLIGLIVVIANANSNNAFDSVTSVKSNWIVGSIVLLSIGLILVIMIIFAFALKPFKKTQEKLDIVNGLTQENVLGQRTIKAFNLQDSQFQKFDIANEELRKTTTKSGYITAMVLPSIYLFMDGALIVATWLSNKSLIGGLQQIYLLVTLMVVALILTIVGVVQIGRAVPSFKRAFEVINSTPSIQYCEKPAKFNAKNSIKITNLTFSYPDSKAKSLKNINLEIKPQEVVGIIGPTGSGKSTLINLIARMYDPTKGQIKLANVDIKKLTKHQLKSTVSYCPQNVILFSGTIRSNLQFGKDDATENEMDAVLKIANLEKFVNEQIDKYDYKIAQRGINLSGGQKQRLAIARTLIKQAPFLLLDDATSALDMITEKNICQELLNNPYKQTIVISSQRINAIRNANKIVVMDEGKIIAIGTHLQLLKTCPYYHDVAVIQMGEKEVNSEINQK